MPTNIRKVPPVRDRPRIARNAPFRGLDSLSPRQIDMRVLPVYVTGRSPSPGVLNRKVTPSGYPDHWGSRSECGPHRKSGISFMRIPLDALGPRPIFRSSAANCRRAGFAKFLFCHSFLLLMFPSQAGSFVPHIGRLRDTDGQSLLPIVSERGNTNPGRDYRWSRNTCQILRLRRRCGLAGRGCRELTMYVLHSYTPGS